MIEKNIKLPLVLKIDHYSLFNLVFKYIFEFIFDIIFKVIIKRLFLSLGNLNVNLKFIL